MSAPAKLWIAIPVKPLAEGKSRLASALTGPQRLALTRRLLQQTLEVAVAAPGMAGVLVVSRDPEILRLAEDAGALALAEETNGRAGWDGPGWQGAEWGLNRAIAQAAAFVRARGGAGLLYLPTDLPLLETADIACLRQAWGERSRAVVLAPSRSGGTNALLLAPPDAIDPAFGLDSFARHSRLARALGLEVTVVESPGLAWDVDTPTEYALLGEG